MNIVDENKMTGEIKLSKIIDLCEKLITEFLGEEEYNKFKSFNKDDFNLNLFCAAMSIIGQSYEESVSMRYISFTIDKLVEENLDKISKESKKEFKFAELYNMFMN